MQNLCRLGRIIVYAKNGEANDVRLSQFPTSLWHKKVPGSIFYVKLKVLLLSTIVVTQLFGFVLDTMVSISDSATGVLGGHVYPLLAKVNFLIRPNSMIRSKSWDEGPLAKCFNGSSNQIPLYP